LHIRLYAPGNYVAVLVKEDWTIIHESDINENGEGLKPGKDYNEGDTGWLVACYHDSCWRSEIATIIRAYEYRMSVIKDSFWYKKIRMTDDDCELVSKIIGKYDHDDRTILWTSERIVLSPFKEKVQ